MAPAWPVNCIAVITCIDTPVAPIGWPFAFSPPEGLTGSLPSFAVQPSSTARAPCPARRQAHRLVFQQLGDGEAVVRFDEGQVVAALCPPRPARAARLRRRPRSRVMSRLLIGRKSFTCTAARKRTALPIARAVSSSASTSAAAPSETSEQSVRFSGGATYGFFSRHVRQNVKAEVLAHLRVGVVDAVLVVLRRDRRQRIGLVAVALEVAARRCGRTRRRSLRGCRLPPSGSWP